jgi:large subunit ribosomal protein L55
MNIILKTTALTNISSCLSSTIRQTCFRASIGRIKRSVYSRLYPVKLVKPDGSSINISYHEPISIIKLPFDLSQLNENDRKRRLLKRQMSNKIDLKQVKQNQELTSKDIKFDPKKYLNMNKKK